MTSMSQDLADIRQEFVEAMQQGDTQKAELRQKAKSLVKLSKIISTNIHDRYKADIDYSIEKAQQEAQDILGNEQSGWRPRRLWGAP